MNQRCFGQVAVAVLALVEVCPSLAVLAPVAEWPRALAASSLLFVSVSRDRSCAFHDHGIPLLGVHALFFPSCPYLVGDIEASVEEAEVGQVIA